MIFAGELNKRVTFQTATITRDDQGSRLTSWSDDFSVWGAIEPISAREQSVAQGYSPNTNHKVRIRFREDVTLRHRIQYGSRAFQITGIVDPFERNEELQLFCSEAEL